MNIKRAIYKHRNIGYIKNIMQSYADYLGLSLIEQHKIAVKVLKYYEHSARPITIECLDELTFITNSIKGTLDSDTTIRPDNRNNFKRIMHYFKHSYEFSSTIYDFNERIKKSIYLEYHASHEALKNQKDSEELEDDLEDELYHLEEALNADAE